jgi:hypothetical protein
MTLALADASGTTMAAAMKAALRAMFIWRSTRTRICYF